MIERLKEIWQWLVGAAVVILGAIFLTRRAGQGHERNATRSAGQSAEHAEMADIALEAAVEQAKTADQQHNMAVEAAKIENREEDITPVEVIKRAKRGRTV